MLENEIFFLNTIQGTTFPDCSSLKELARQTRMLLGCIEILNPDKNLAPMWEEALGIAFEASYFIQKNHVQEVREKLELSFKHHDLIDALKRVVAMNHCVWRGWQAEHYSKIVFSCLNCGAHQYSFPVQKDVSRVLDQFWREFLRRHGGC